MGFVDQRLLPGELILVRTSDWREVVDAVKTLAVRGAPAIGVAGAAAVMLAAYEYAVAEGMRVLLRNATAKRASFLPEKAIGLRLMIVWKRLRA